MAILTINRDRALLTAAPNAALFRTLPHLEGPRRWLRGGELSLTPSEYNVALLQGAYPGLVIEREEYFPPARPCVPPRDYPQRPIPPAHKHQVTALAKAMQKQAFALFMDPGTGKTRVALDIAGQRWAAGEISAVLVIAPKGVHRQWVEEQIPLHYGADCRAEFYPIKRTVRPALMEPDRERLTFMTINIDGIKTQNGMEICREFIAAHERRVLIIIDESHLIKGKSTQRWAAASALAENVRYRLILTGTPIAKDLTDEWAQFYWLDDRIIGIRYLTAFRREYCIMGGFEGRSVVGHRNLDRFKALVAPYTFRVTKEEVGVLPPAYEAWHFDLNAEQKRMMKEMRRQLLTQIETGEIATAANAAVAVMRLQTIANGFLMDESRVVHDLFADPAANPRIAALLEYIAANPGKLIIWCRFIRDIQSVMAVLGDQAVAYYGAINEKDCAIAVQKFLNDPDTLFFVANPAKGGVGLNLQGECRRAIYYSNSDNFIHRQQSEHRINRLGTPGGVIYTDLIATGSTDAKILRNLKHKLAISSMTIDDVKELIEDVGV